MYVVPLGTPVIAWVGKIVIAEGPQLGNSVIVDMHLAHNLDGTPAFAAERATESNGRYQLGESRL